MHSSIISSKYSFWKDNPVHILDYLESKFILSGWTIDKKVSKPFYDKGEGKVFPTIVRYWNSTELGRNCHVPYYSKHLELYAAIRGAHYSGTYYYPFLEGDPASYGSIGTLDTDYLVGKTFTARGNCWANHYSKCSGVFLTDSGFTGSGTRTLVWVGGYNISGWYSSAPTTITAGEKYLMGRSDSGGIIYFADITLIESDWHNLGNKSHELYVHTTTTQGETIYLSIFYDYENLKLKFYANTGFDVNSAVDKQPGRIKSSDSNTEEYFYLKVPAMWFPRYTDSSLFTGDENSFFFYLYTENLAMGSRVGQYVYMGQVDKFFNFNGGAVITGSYFNRYTIPTSTTAAGASAYYVLYEGTWYGQTIGSSVSNKQGFIDLVTPSNYTTAGYNHYSGEIFVTQQVAGVNLGLTDNFEYKPIGTVHNFYKHYGVTPTLPMELKINGDTYWSIPLDANNRKAVKAVEV